MRKVALASMVNFNVEEYFSTCRGWQVLICYAGAISEKEVDAALVEVDRRLEASYPLPFAKRVYNVLVEDLQNLFHHADFFPPDVLPEPEQQLAKSFGLFCVGLADGECRILTGNFIRPSEEDAIRSRVDELNSMDSEALRDYYRQVLNNEVYSVKGGGGLGLIDIARKSRQKLRYRFYPVEEGYLFYLLEVRVGM